MGARVWQCMVPVRYNATLGRGRCSPASVVPHRRLGSLSNNANSATRDLKSTHLYSSLPFPSLPRPELELLLLLLDRGRGRMEPVDCLPVPACLPARFHDGRVNE